jgi:CubicO group peptidase (beta-lactamase class C family)
MFTAAAIMQLVEQGLIDLDAPVTDYLPEFRLDDPRYTAITVRQLLAHTSGLPWLPATTEVRSEEWGFQDPDTQEGALARMVAGLDGVALVADPGGGQVLYSNTAFDVLGDIVAAVSGQPYETYMQDNIFKPLGMESTTFVLDEADPALLAAGYRQDPESDDMSAWEFFPYNPQHSPSAGLISNVDDMSLWAEALLNEGELDGARILEAGSLEEIWSPASTMGWGGLLQDYGLGWILAEDAGHRLVWHVGGVPGFHSNLMLAPEDGVAVVTMLNLNNYLQDEPWYATEVGTAVMYELLGIAE